MEEIPVLIQREPDEEWLAYDMILRDKAPGSRVSGVVPIVSHHKVVVHLEGVGRSRLAVYQDARRSPLDRVALKVPDAPLVERKILRRQRDRLPLGGDVDRTIIVPRPVE